jgi:large subunit ribosomal protein L9
MRVRLLFLQDVLPRFRAGEVREVAPGYARNYLIPQGFAVPATKDQLNRIAKVKTLATERRQVETVRMGDLAGLLQGASITIRMRSGEGGRLYGAVTNMLLAEELKKAIGVEVDRRQIDLREPIRGIGTFQVPVRLGADHNPTITVTVESSTQFGQAGTPVAAAPAAAAAPQPQEAGPTEAAT